MPIPEDIVVYGRTDLLRAIAHRQPAPGAQPPFNRCDRAVTRSLTLHFTHGWCYRGWRAEGQNWFGAVYNIDLDGTLYQCCEMDTRALHTGGAPHFTGAYSFVNDTSLGIEIARFGKFRRFGENYRVDGYPGMDFTLYRGNESECDYAQLSQHQTGTRRFSLRKFPGGAIYQHLVKKYYFVCAASFDDDRNPERPQYTMDILFTEEQYRTLIVWAKAMCERYRIPKKFFRHPISGRENPWIDTHVLALNAQPEPIRNEARERVRAFKGIMGHMNLQGDRVDPGASMDYYRLKRGISDRWWYPINTNDTPRPINSLDENTRDAYLAMPDFGAIHEYENFCRVSETALLGFYPIGGNRIWHGGLHLPTASSRRPVYAMANGWIVAARVSNPLVNGVGLSTSACFVLIKHYVHTRDNNEEIDYGRNSTSTIYSLYMHLDPLSVRRDARGDWATDYDQLPCWLNHFLLDNPQNNALNQGGIIFPNQPVLLGDHLGWTGISLVAFPATVGRTVHIEVFTTDSPVNFSRSPWVVENNRREDSTNGNIVADVGTIDQFIIDTAGDGIDIIDIKNAAPAMRNIAVRYKSEWSVQTPGELCQEVIIDGTRRNIGDIVTDSVFQNSIRPFCFHAEMRAMQTAPADVIGPFLNNPVVWHLHPFTFLRWMNERVERHERILAEEDRRRPAAVRSNLRIENSYVVGFQNLAGPNPQQLPQTGPGVTYPEAAYGENTYEVRVNELADAAALRNGPQNATRFHLHLLEFLDIVNDQSHGVRIVEGYVSTDNVQCSAESMHAMHRAGCAVDIRPGIGTAPRHWFLLYTTANTAREYLARAYGHSLVMRITADPPPAHGSPSAAELRSAAQELQRRLEEASANGDDDLAAQPPLQHLNMLRMHVGFDPGPAQPASIVLRNLQIFDASGGAATGPVTPTMRLRFRVTTVGAAESSSVHFFVFSRVRNNRHPRDISDAVSLSRLYGGLTFDLARLQRHNSIAGSFDSYVGRAVTPVTGVGANGEATVEADFLVPERVDPGAASLYIAAIVPAGSRLAGIGTSMHHTILSIPNELPYPHILETYWATDSAGLSRVTEGRRRQGEFFFIVKYRSLPQGCSSRVMLRQNREQSQQTVQLAQGDGQASVRWPVGARGDYHCSITIAHSASGLSITDGCTLRVRW